MSWRRSCAGASAICRPTMAARSISGCRRGSSSSRPRARTPSSGRCLAGGYWLRPARAGRGAGHRFHRRGCAGGARGACGDRSRTFRARPARGDLAGAAARGWLAAARRRARAGRRAWRSKMLGGLGRRRSGHGAGRPSGDAVLAGLGRGARPGAGREQFGQSADIPDSIAAWHRRRGNLDAAAAACLAQIR